ncbi:MAG: MscS family inner membrane protein YnaI [Candidatus Accumulibacter appositus]|uniref:MscS family inner membrane protein YnaI n=1 Tax=Candidatus Accumulibacter appositus TaxID=1454003 RepID=A0A011NBM9_9PROT|nr:mechanosensitive ion channel family protein [Accumulibacter sp.]EXI80053.1 MAG: MscS family inner membrane protein YnaI [Candidatus Accumulibacter appositus]HRF06177.1 mechanosensitive ion channel family protein [Accumulibacter sp.]
MKVDWLEKALAPLVGRDETLLLVLQVFLVVLGVVVANFILRRVLARLEARTLQTSTPWDNALVSAARQPLTVVAWVLGLSFAARIVEAGTEATVFEIIDPVRIIGVIACIAWFLVRFIGNIQNAIVAQRLARGESIDRTTVDAIGKLLRISVLITAALVGLQSLGFSISGVLAFGGIGGIAVGFAAKDLLANFFGGLMVYLDRPFAVGDWIRSPDKDIEGTVEEIGWRLTRIRTFDKRPLYVPNGIFAQIAVENPSRMSNRRIKEIVGVRYDDVGKLAAITDDIKAMLRAHPEIDQQQTMIVNFDQFSASSLDILVYTFTRTTVWVAYHEIKQDVLLKIAEIVARHGAEIAFPTRTLHMTGSRNPLPPKHPPTPR